MIFTKATPRSVRAQPGHSLHTSGGREAWGWGEAAPQVESAPFEEPAFHLVALT